MFVNTLSADGKYPFQYCENSQLAIQKQLSEQEKPFSEFFVRFLESRSIFKHFGKNMMVIANDFPKFRTVKKFVTPLCKKCLFGRHLDSQHVKVFAILAESAWECFYHVCLSIWAKLIRKISPLGLGEI